MTLKPSAAGKVGQHRGRLRRHGLRPVQIWVPDVHAPEFEDEAHRQSLAVARSDLSGDDQAFIDSTIDWREGDE